MVVPRWKHVRRIWWLVAVKWGAGDDGECDPVEFCETFEPAVRLSFLILSWRRAS